MCRKTILLKLSILLEWRTFCALTRTICITQSFFLHQTVTYVEETPKCKIWGWRVFPCWDPQILNFSCCGYHLLFLRYGKRWKMSYSLPRVNAKCEACNVGVACGQIINYNFQLIQGMQLMWVVAYHCSYVHVCIMTTLDSLLRYWVAY